MLIVVHYCYRFLCTVVTDSCALLLPFFVHSPYHFLCTRRFCLQEPNTPLAFRRRDECHLKQQAGHEKMAVGIEQSTINSNSFVANVSIRRSTYRQSEKQLAQLRCQLHPTLCGFDVSLSLICVYLAVGDHFPGRRSEKSFLPSSYSGILRSTSSNQALSSTPRALQVARSE